MIRLLSGRLRKLFCLLLFTGFSVAHAGSYDDFFRAIQQDDSEKIRHLLNRGFDASTVDAKGQYGLYIALSDGTLKAARTLIDWPKTDVNQVNLKGESALMLAALKGHLALADLLIKKGADVNKTGWTPLHYAASAGHLPVIRLLLDNSAYIDAESPNGSTPLMMAAMYGTPDAVNLLLQQGADPTLKNQQGLTALQFAQRGNRSDSVEIIAAFLRGKQPLGKW
ncbi:MAG: ankyrin repeat domain-containing protein [Pseudomonadota bacterium]|nr:ankyrin repeat domain-containing protein [Pseudomonadota bacterium]